MHPLPATVRVAFSLKCGCPGPVPRARQLMIVLLFSTEARTFMDLLTACDPSLLLSGLAMNPLSSKDSLCSVLKITPSMSQKVSPSPEWQEKEALLPNAASLETGDRRITEWKGRSYIIQLATS